MDIMQVYELMAIRMTQSQLVVNSFLKIVILEDSMITTGGTLLGDGGGEYFHNVTIESVDEWGKRRLAYLINDEAEGYYVFYNFESNPEFPAELERIVKITDGVLRVMVIKK